MNVNQPFTGEPTAIAPGCNDGPRPVTGDQDRPSKVLTQKSARAMMTWVGPLTEIPRLTARYSMLAGGRGAEPAYAHGRSIEATVAMTIVSPWIGEPLELPVTSPPVAVGAPALGTLTSTTTGSVPGKDGGAVAKPTWAA